MKAPALALSAFCIAASASAQSSFDSVSKFGWGANTGWISFRHDQPASPEGIRVGESHLSGYAYSPNTGWINFGSNPSNGFTYSNAGSDRGVNHDGAGNLGGFAWAANTGWISFGWADSSNPDRPRIDLLSGQFSGHAWSPNTGWVNLGAGLLIARSVQRTDSDVDGMDDAWESQYFGNLVTATAGSDFDKDGSTDVNEYLAGSAPKDSASYLRIISQTYSGELTQTTIQFSSNATRTYRIEYSNDLLPAWTNSSLGTFLPDAGSSTTRVINFPGNAKKFFRAVAVRPLSP